MNKKNLIGVVLSLLLFVGSFLLTGAASAYWNLAAFLVVVSGLTAAMLVSYPTAHIRNAFRVARNAYANGHATSEEIVNTLLDLSVKSKVDGVLSLERSEHREISSFLQNGLILLVDNYKEEEIREALNSEMAFFNLRRQQSERFFQTMARMAPAFGVAGSVIGLIGLLMGINDTAVILKNIPVAFISTLYGLVLSNLVFSPIAENINYSTRVELLNQKLVLEGIVAISKEQNSYKLERKLASFLSPSEREGKTETLRRITRKYVQKRNQPVDIEDMAGSESLLTESTEAA
ncbi:MAG: MotA/TolQ/ExbB proton channel family protein [Pseudodesulfovibrio sp.]|uniref:MotA/TolQ/ExbB proton channel n=1 Tax=Pseudodesulfovibrio aespoeensis (strain ATCC 700646 / DSM 10631 / Aspo-2) TaxID=643562 RepID=E6VVZ6_PSEA9|nr:MULTISPECIES: MotA/TolQ/ExbB proton channel family protein [Pseudodesulfovibrio]MBU4192216.1 MotA/TolQ/ExbB proton channel family protein [Pseudomonadota bacterium]ADU62441.1 MotA/TolQ/ExbB proton channel [Pseudodesulfovibrio aespoeensis Aspo-2]MBU4244373.1 MotA/TolQ/ExbB proton channel family protein [Pseudomonadota bacterium]MBU4380333.1 MotA/TolQ/ExbB proton channel family protein [Pseudomonadota bacterium]MBU4473894.1 MotA/TolQ/ExbB proton channel family protein [Pseudomonadota bacteriu